MANTYLTVPFAEKDSAKSKGARWDSVARKWYAPEGVDLVAFAQWLPTESEVARAVVDAPAVTALQAVERGVPLSRLLAGVAKAVADSYSSGVWTTAEVLRVSARDGHVYLELSERDAQGRVVAKAQAAIWARTAERIIPEFERATGATLGAGIKLLVRARPVFKAQFGFSLEIDGIDPTYTLGDLEAKKREIRERLKREGLFDLNRRLAQPWDYSLVLVVAPQGGAGLGDFAKEAARLERFGVCRFVYTYSRFQGEGAAAEILASLRVGLAALDDGEIADAVIVIRGGGAVNDLAWLNDYDLARFICECAVPVHTGIGHERDSTTLDEVAHTRFDTPSKVIGGIEQHVARRAREVRSGYEFILRHVATDSASARRAVERLDTGVRSSASETVFQARTANERLMAEMRLSSVRKVHEASTEVHRLFGEVRSGAGSQIIAARHEAPAALSSVTVRAATSLRDARAHIAAWAPAILGRASLDGRRARDSVQASMSSVSERARQTVQDAAIGSQALIREIAGQGPQKTLARGFAVVRSSSGATLTSAAAATTGTAIDIIFSDGRLSADVRTVEAGLPAESLISRLDEKGN